MNIPIWALQGFTAIIFLFAGANKLIYSREELVSKGITGLENLPLKMVRIIGGLEILGALGLILPYALMILPGLTSIAAICLGLVMVPAAIIHTKRRENKMVVVNIVILLACMMIAYFRDV